jgi:hypothetical protein
MSNPENKGSNKVIEKKEPFGLGITKPSNWGNTPTASDEFDVLRLACCWNKRKELLVRRLEENSKNGTIFTTKKNGADLLR